MRTTAIALAATLAVTPCAYAQTYKDTGGTIVMGVVPLNCPSGGGTCTGTQSGGSTATKAEGVCTIATGGTAQQCITAAQNTNGFLLYVSPGFSNTDPIYCSDTNTTTTGSSTGALPLNASTATAVGGSFSSPSWWAPGHAVWCVGANAGDKVGWHAN